jgi:hypothetical protein
MRSPGGRLCFSDYPGICPVNGTPTCAARSHAHSTLAKAGAREHRDWRWADGPVPEELPYIVETPTEILVHTLEGRSPPEPAILVSASAVRKLGGRGVAARMEQGAIAAELPFATAWLDSGSAN